jgi:hypothetical protein
MKSMMKLVGVIALAALIGFSMASCESQVPENNDTDDDFVPVTNITGVNTDVTVGTVSLSGRVVPSNATNKTIRWSLQSEGDTEGTTISGNNLTTIMEGYVIVRATVVNGKAEGENYTKNFNISINPFVAVTSITRRFPDTGKVGEELILDGDANPYNASYTDIQWSISINDAGATRPTLKGDVLTTRATGPILVTATIKNGLAEGTPYTQEFNIGIID